MSVITDLIIIVTVTEVGRDSRRRTRGLTSPSESASLVVAGLRQGDDGDEGDDDDDGDDGDDGDESSLMMVVMNND